MEYRINNKITYEISRYSPRLPEFTHALNYLVTTFPPDSSWIIHIDFKRRDGVTVGADGDYCSAWSSAHMRWPGFVRQPEG
jgi:hypothetical protein